MEYKDKRKNKPFDMKPDIYLKKTLKIKMLAVELKLCWNRCNKTFKVKLNKLEKGRKGRKIVHEVIQ